jgi:isopenicillin N synthase-like dioxygenase
MTQTTPQHPGGIEEHPAVPILDLQDYIEPTTKDRFVRALRDVCHSVGFLYLTGHGVDHALNVRVTEVSRTFFGRSDGEKRSIAMVNSPHFRGYTPVGGELTRGRADLREEVDLGPDRPAVQSPRQPWQRLQGPNQWPESVPEFRTAMTTWAEHMDRLGRTLLRALAEGLEIDPEHFRKWVTPHPEATIKAIRYPAPAAGQHPQGVGTHRDFGLLTFVLQDEVGGLQVERADGSYVDVPNLPGSFVVNLGEMLQLATHGYYKATVHRVISPPPGAERFSTIYFFNPRLAATLDPVRLPSHLGPHARGGASDDPANPILNTYGENILKVRLRAHPDVAQRHHSDLLDTITTDRAPSNQGAKPAGAHAR